MKKAIFINLFVAFSVMVFAQATTVTGVVTDKKTKEPVINATIRVQGTGVYAISGVDGIFSIKAPPDAILEIKHLSYSTMRITAGEAHNIVLEPIEISLDEIVVQSSPLEDISHSIVITDELKKGSQVRNVADLFNDVPGFSLQKRSSVALEPSFRSFKYEEMNVKYDGQAKIVHACPNRMDPVTGHVIPEEVSKIEIIKGPYTVRYGQRFGATVNLVTKPVKPGVHGFHGNVEGGYETNGSNWIGRAQLQYVTKKLDVTVNGESRDFGNYTDGAGTRVPAAFTTNSYSVKMGVNPVERQRLQVDFRQKFTKNVLHAGLPMDSPKDDSYLVTIDYGFHKISDKVRSFVAKAYYSDVDHLMDNVLRPSFKRVYARTPVTSNTIGGKVEIGLTPAKKWLIYAGLDADIIKRDGHKMITVKTNPVGIPFDPPVEKQVNVWHNATTQDYGIFTEANYKLTPRLTANAGMRVDFVSAGVKEPDAGFAALYDGEIKDVSEANIGGNISLKYKYDGLQFQLAYGRGTRSASMVERYIYRFSIGSDSRDYIGNPYLKPEINNQIELSAMKHFDRFYVGSSIFYSYMHNYITARLNSAFTASSGGCGGGPVKAPKQFWNVNAYQYGFDGFFRYNLVNDALQFFGDIAYTYAQNTTFREPLAQIAPMSGHLGVKWEKGSYWLDFRSRLVGEQNRFSLSFNETATPGYTVLDFRAGIKPLKGLTIGAAALNVLDKAYYSHLNFSYKNSNENAGRILEAGRSFSGYVKYNF